MIKPIEVTPELCEFESAKSSLLSAVAEAYEQGDRTRLAVAVAVYDSMKPEGYSSVTPQEGEAIERWITIGMEVDEMSKDLVYPKRTPQELQTELIDFILFASRTTV